MKKIFIFVSVILTVSFSYKIDKTFEGYFTYYNYGGFGACGSLIDAGSQKFAAVHPEWFIAAEAIFNDNLICNKCLKIEYQGKIVKVPIRDKCFQCDRNTMVLSYPAFRDLEQPDEDNVKKANFTFINC